MKKLLFCAFALTLLIGMASCEKKPGTEITKNLLELDKSELTFQSAGGTQTVTVTGEGWTTEESEDWMNIEEAEGKFNVVVDVNTIDEPREGIVTVKNSDDTKTITVKQSAAATGISVDIPELPFDGQGATKTVAVTSEITEWTATAEGEEEWITITPNYSNDTFDVTVSAHIEDGPRTGTITVSNGIEEATVVVTQEEVAWVELLGFRGGYYTLDSDEALCNPLLQFWDSPINSAGQPLNYPVIQVCVNPVIEQPDLTVKRLYFPAGTYKLGNIGSPTPYLYNDGYNNFVLPAGATTWDDVVDAVDGQMVITDDGGTRTVEVIYVLEDDTIFKGRYIGNTAFNNPFIAGLLEDLDLGAIDVTGKVHLDDSIVPAGYPGLWTFHICSDGVTVDEVTNAPQGTGYYIYMNTSIHTSDGQPDSSIKEGVYDVYNVSILDNETGIGIGTSNGSVDVGTWIYRLENGEVIERAPFMSGKVSIDYDGSAYTFGLDALDNNNMKIQGTLTGELIEF
jgi:hypothetical protein